MGLIEMPASMPPVDRVDRVDPGEVSQTRRERLEQTQRDNDATIAALAARGVGVEAASLTNIRLVLLVEHLLGDLDADARLDYEEKVQAKFTEQFAEVAAQLNRAVLLQGVGGAHPPIPPPAGGWPNGNGG